jgi:hypothetical protein
MVEGIDKFEALTPVVYHMALKSGEPVIAIPEFLLSTVIL